MSTKSLMTSDPKLALLLRECADYIDAGTFHHCLYTAMHDLNVYVSRHGDANTVSKHVDKVSATLNSLSKNFAKQLGLTKAEQEKRQATSSKNAERARADLADLPGVVKKPTKPSFQRPSNPQSTLIANGWIEQQRRSKMRVVWKDILASLVEGRKPGEETTLWVQREVVHSITGKRELEALHQIPIKWLEDVQFLDFYGDHRFSIKVYNVPEEFLFKCADEESAQNWVLTLRSVSELVKKQKENEGLTKQPTSQHQEVPRTPQIAVEPPRTGQRMAIKELKALAHGAGINTQGMDRTELEKVVAQISAGTATATTAATAAASYNADIDHDAELESARRREEDERKQEALRRQELEGQALKEEEIHQKLEEEQRERIALRVAEQRRLAEEEEMRRAAALLEEQRRVAAAAAAAEDHRRRVEAERAAEIQRRQEEEHRRRIAEQQAAELRRRQQEEVARQQQAQWAAQQQQWQQYQQQQQAQQQQWQHHHAQQQQQQWQQHAQWQHQQAQKQQYQQQQRQSPTPPSAQGRPQPPPPSTDNASSADNKYAKMATASSGEEKITEIKRNVLVNWALQPPQLQTLRQIPQLLSTIHNVFPPAFGIVEHEYFKKWKPIAQQDLVPIGAAPDKEKLKKAVRKLRFFLHPDKLPKDLDEEQAFISKMLWDISSDAWEEFQKHESDLDWVTN